MMRDWKLIVFISAICFNCIVVTVDSRAQKKKKEKGMVWLSYDGNDSLLYQAKFRISDIDSVLKGLKDHSEPLEERYIYKPGKTPKTKGH